MLTTRVNNTHGTKFPMCVFSDRHTYLLDNSSFAPLAIRRKKGSLCENKYKSAISPDQLIYGVCSWISAHTVRGVASSVLRTLWGGGGGRETRSCDIRPGSIDMTSAFYEFYVPILLRRVRCTSVRACCDNLSHPLRLPAPRTHTDNNRWRVCSPFSSAIPRRKLMAAVSKIESPCSPPAAAFTAIRTIYLPASSSSLNFEGKWILIRTT